MGSRLGEVVREGQYYGLGQKQCCPQAGGPGGGRGYRYQLYLIHHSVGHDIPEADLQAGIHRERRSVQPRGSSRHGGPL